MLSGDCNICINGKMPSYSATCVECGLSRKHYKPITNADRIRAMSDEELADKFEEIQLKTAKAYGNDDLLLKGELKKYWLEWLKQEVSE